MNRLEEVFEHLTVNNVMSLASSDGVKPKVRPIGFIMKFKDRLYFSTSNQGPIYKELNSNPNFELLTFKPDEPSNRIRVSANAVFDNSNEVYEEYYRLNPEMKDVPNMALFYADNWEAIIYKGFQDRREIKQ